MKGIGMSSYLLRIRPSVLVAALAVLAVLNVLFWTWD
jgi:hypothetical protein